MSNRYANTVILRLHKQQCHLITVTSVLNHEYLLRQGGEKNLLFTDFISSNEQNLFLKQLISV
jgi:hypothetical protein